MVFRLTQGTSKDTALHALLEMKPSAYEKRKKGPPSRKPLRSLKTYLGYTTTPVASKLPLNLQDLVSVALSQQGLPKPQTVS